MGGRMTLDILFEAFIEQSAKVDNIWSMYLVVHLGIFWFFFLLHRPLLIIERVIAVMAYMVFAFVNGSALLNSYRLLEALRRDAVNTFQKELQNVPATYEALLTEQFSNILTLIFITHGGAFILVLFIMLFRNTMVAFYYRHYPPAHTGAGRINVD